jgi:Ser/Thr protein kinase RdoA (MazF antagonist)
MLERVGEVMGTLHRHAEGHVAAQPVNRHRETWKDLRAWADGREGADHIYSTDDRALLERAAAHALAQVETSGNEYDYGLIHADLHQYNYMFHGEEVRVIDFDDCLFAPFTYDLAITLWYLVGRPTFQALEGALLRGYERVRALPAGYRSDLPLLMLARTLSMVEWVLGWSSPTLLPWGPQFLRNAPQSVRYYLDRI